jgi:hypothetical protein
MCCIPALDRKALTSRGLPNFLIDFRGTVCWVNLTDNIAFRARPGQVLGAFDQIESAGQ